MNMMSIPLPPGGYCSLFDSTVPASRIIRAFPILSKAFAMAGVTVEKVDLDLIELVKAHPILYQQSVRSEPYKLSTNEKALWASIATSLGMTAAKCMSRWNVLKARYRRECKQYRQVKSLNIKTEGQITWPLLYRMSFLSSQQNFRKSSSSFHSCDRIFFNVKMPTSTDNEQLQEAMEEQTIGPTETGASGNVKQSAMEAQATEPIGLTASGEVVDKRIDVLLQGLDDINRAKAQKRIVEFLCKCQVKALNNELIDDVVI